MFIPTGEPIVFVVDDEHVIAMTLGLILRNNGYDSRTFSAPEHALNAASCHAPDLLVTDMVMPGMSGIELATKIREACPDCKMLLFSGQATFLDSITKESACALLFDSFLAKPVHPMVLLKTIEDILSADPTPPNAPRA